jgi:glycosyltransferase involved in cell wall biosynthesis
MRIAEIAPPWFSVPPPAYGGIERIVAQLADGLTDRGHDVTLFAAGGSKTTATLELTMLDPPDPSLVSNPWLDAFHALSSYLAIGDEFDVVHDHSGVVGPALGSLRRGRPPVVHTLHGPWNEPTRRYYSLLHQHVHLVAISETQRKLNPDVRYAGLVYNGVEVADYRFEPRKDDFLVFIGRANPDKGPAVAVEVARQAGLPLAMIVKKDEDFERRYWDEAVAPTLHDEVQVFEHVEHDQKVDLLARARALLFPIDWPEPFGLVMTEAMACGTPVVARPRGAATEIVEDGVTGFLRNSIEDLATAAREVDRCSPAACRLRVERCFSSSAMVHGYEEVFRAVTRS